MRPIDEAFCATSAPTGIAASDASHTGTRGSGGLVEIVDGLEPGEQVATSGLTKLENGIAVSVKERPTNQEPKF